MNQIAIIQETINYIESNLKGMLDIQVLASQAGYSHRRFQHLFKEVVGMPVSAYIKKRRLSLALYDIQQGMSVTDAALLYGFDTHAGFYKAFRRRFGCSPKQYLALNQVGPTTSLNLYEESAVMITKRKIRTLLDNWMEGKSVKLDAIEDTLEMGGLSVSNMIFDIDDKFIFKIYRDDFLMNTHIRLAEVMEGSDIGFSKPIPTQNGEMFVNDGNLNYLLMRKVPGQILLVEERYQWEPLELGMVYGKSIGMLHSALQKVEDGLEVLDSSFLDTVMDWALPRCKSIMIQRKQPMPDSLYETVAENLSRLYPYLKRQVIHRDPNPSNIIFKDNEVSGFIDFDISEKNIRIFDPCYCATGILSEAFQGLDKKESLDKWPKVLKGILDGYCSVQPMSLQESEAIPYVIYGIQMIFIAYLEEIDQYPAVAEANRDMLMYLWEEREALFGL